MTGRFRPQLTGWVDGCDLRNVCAKYDVLQKAVDDFELQEWQFVVYANKARDRARIVMMLGQIPTMLLLPVGVDRPYNISLTLAVNDYFRRRFPATPAAAASVKTAIEEGRLAKERSDKVRKARGILKKDPKIGF